LEKIKFPYFVKKNQTTIDRGFLVFGLLIFSLFVLWMNEEYFNVDFIEWVFNLTTGLAFASYFFLIFFSVNEKEKLYGNYVGYLIFEPDRILASDHEYRIENLKKIEFSTSDYEGKKYTNYKSIDPKISHGVQNWVRLKTIDDSVFELNFQLRYEDEFEKKLRDILINYHLKGKISFLALIQYIGISDSYEDIQEFKKELEKLKS
jgi:hypothetical protein